MGITYGDHLIDSGHGDITPEQEREKEERELRREVEDVLRGFHRNSCYPESDRAETDIAIDAILRITAGR